MPVFESSADAKVMRDGGTDDENVKNLVRAEEDVECTGKESCRKIHCQQRRSFELQVKFRVLTARAHGQHRSMHQ